jgi:hypothetical protein
MTCRHKNRCKPDGICLNYQGHKDSQKQRLKEKFKSNFQTRNETILCNSKTKTQKHKTRTRDVQNKRENESLLC